jgi:deoxyribonuclease-4
MIRFGPAGIPLSCKGRTLEDGIEDVHNLSLNALEVQMVRSSAYTRPPEEEEVGLTIKDIEEDFVVEVLRDGEPIDDPNEPIEEEDDLMYMPSGVANTFQELYSIGDMAKRMDVNLSIHTPYYMDLGSNSDLTELCLNSVRHAALILDAMDGDIVVTNVGLYDGVMPEDEVNDNIFNNLAYIVDWWHDCGLKPRLGVEVTGQQDVFGSLDQILDLCDQIDGIVPVVNFAHQHARTNGTLLEVDDFLSILETVEPYSNGRIHTAFSGVDYSDSNERRLMPIKKGDMKFDPLAEALIEMKPEATVISTSPLLEHDAMYMRIIHERALSKKVAKDLREKRKAEAAASGE